MNNSKTINQIQEVPSISAEKKLLAEKEHALKVLKIVLMTRFADQKMSKLVKQNKGSSFFLSAEGHEIIGALAALQIREGLDWAFPYYRDRALAIGLNCPVKELMGAFLAKEIRHHSGGRMMLDHFSDKARKIPPQSSCIGSQFLQAVGVAKSIKLKNLREVVYVSAGDGATSQGDFHEALNFSCIHKLPIVFVIQDNGWAISTPSSEQTAGGSIAQMASGYSGLKIFTAEGSDFEKSRQAIESAFEEAHQNSPALVVIRVPRIGAHTISDDSRKYRDEQMEKLEQQKDPLMHLEKWIIKKNYLSAEQLENLKQEIKQKVEATALEAEKYPDPIKEKATEKVFKAFDLLKHVQIVEQTTACQATVAFAEKGKGKENQVSDQMDKIVMVDAINRGLIEEMEKDSNVVVYGEDVARGKGGVFGLTSSLTDKFFGRCFNTPLAESTIIGTAMGMSYNGYKPVVEIQFADYVWTGMNQLVNELASLHYRCNGEWSCPVVVRMPYGGYIQGGPYHSQSIEAVLTHIPGLKVVVPSNAEDAKRLLKTAICDPNPVIFLEHKALYRQRSFAARKEPGKNEFLPFGKAKVVTEGQDITVVGWGMMVAMGYEVVKRLKKEQDINVELIDLRTLNPLDLTAILTSLKKTGKLLILQEAFKTCGFAAEIAARIMEDGFEYLDAPIQRVAGADCPIPYNKDLENQVLPQKEDIEKAIIDLINF